MLVLHPEQPTSLVSQIVEGIRDLIRAQKLKADSKLPSIRAFAAAHGVSVFTVVEAYDRLVAQGLLVSRSNAGFFVKRRGDDGAAAGAAAPSADLRFDARWYLRQVFENANLPLKPGCGWLPHDWLFEDGMRRSLRSLAAGATDIGGYGLPLGHLALRSVVAESLSERQIVIDAGQVLLTQGSSQALDLVARQLLKPGDEVLVDDPGYPNLMFMLRFLGVHLIGVPRTPTGYDLPALEALLAVHRPKAFFTQPRLQSPTCSMASLPQLVRLLQLAQEHRFVLVENDIYADMDAPSRPSLASLSQLRHVIHVSSFSKTISPNIRVELAQLVAQRSPDLMKTSAQSKMAVGN